MSRSAPRFSVVLTFLPPPPGFFFAAACAWLGPPREAVRASPPLALSGEDVIRQKESRTAIGELVLLASSAPLIAAERALPSMRFPRRASRRPTAGHHFPDTIFDVKLTIDQPERHVASFAEAGGANDHDGKADESLHVERKEVEVVN